MEMLAVFHMCAPCSDLPFNISTMCQPRVTAWSYISTECLPFCAEDDSILVEHFWYIMALWMFNGR